MPSLHAALAAPSSQQADVVIYGATPGGIGAAVSAARLGRSVILCEYEDHIGGIVSNGLTNADIGKRQAVGGLFYEFTRRVVKRYEEQDRNDPAKPNLKLCRDGYWYEASAAEQIFHQMIEGEAPRIRLLLRHELVAAQVDRNQLTRITLESRQDPGTRIDLRAPVFIDATYEGDLAAMAKVPFRIGRESRSEYQEAHAGRIYMRFRDTALLPGSTGEADQATQAFCFRFHVTNDPAKRIPIEKPNGYQRADYALTLEDLRAGKIQRFRDVIQVYPMPNGRFELNSDHAHPDTGIPRESLDLAEECWAWPTSSPAARRKIYERYRTHNVGLIWFLQNDPEVPETVRQDALQYGWHKEEWPSNQHIPRQVYVRQGRRILGDAILTERDADVDPKLQRTRVQPTSIAVIEWAFDPHGHHKYDPAHPGVREGYIFVEHEPFQVPYGVVVPQKIDGLLVPVACSCSHVAYNALRMEPVFIALGEACGIAAHLAIDRKVPLRRVPVDALQTLLVERRGVITFYGDLHFQDPAFAAFQWLGARGLNPGYEASKEEKLTQRNAAEKLARVLSFAGKTWQIPASATDRPLSTSVLTAWLQNAGYLRQSQRAASEMLDLAQFAAIVYESIAPLNGQK
ncbi:FAD-dependent oxidoreductase [Bryobacter aggregatus]|uniref:FAD-dependent oxidoreductase n=1 Tax=Bryobacter aggregatus TaxID=360054 RepID=UPI000689CF3A|nr:FAD-dependent oxidoreductase [Bryobacter aggregatus]